MVTPSGDIQMQTFSVTKTVNILVLFIQFYPFYFDRQYHVLP